MKKQIMLLVVLVLGLILSSACAHSKKTENNEVNNMVKFESGNYFNKDWSETAGNYRGVVVPNKETALNIAQAIFSGLEKSKEMQDYIPQSVFYDEQDEIWIVSFWKESNQITLGGDCSIAIQKSDGKVLRIWFGE